MMTRNKFPRHVAFHEAGHAIGHVYLLQGAMRVDVAPRGYHFDDDGERCQCTNDDCEAYAGTCVPEASTTKALLGQVARDEAERWCIAIAAGPIAEARYMRNYRNNENGKWDGDWQQASEIAENVTRNHRQFVDKCIRRAHAFVKHPTIWAHICEVADVLTKTGYVCGEDALLKRRLKVLGWD